MKRLLLILVILFVFLTACQKDGQDYFLLPRILYVTFDDGEVSVTGRLETAEGRTVFLPDEPRGLEITLTDSGGTVSYEGLVFENSTVEMTRLMPLHKALCEGSVQTEFKDREHPDTVRGEGFVLTVHKELTE